MRAAVKAKFVDVEGEVIVARYDSERWALAIFDETEGERPEVLSINLAGYGFKQLEGHVFVKTYSEHEGLPEALEAAGIATKVGEPVSFGPYDASAWLMKLNDELLKQGPR